MKHLVPVILAAAVGCGGGDDGATPDAARPVDAAKPIDAPPTVGNALSTTLFLNTEGVTFAMGPDDATTDTTSLVAKSGTAAGFMVGDPDRTAEIAAIVSDLKGIYAPYNATITTTRPTSGPYDELVITDDKSTAFGFPNGVNSVIPVACNHTASVMGFVFATTASAGADRHGFVVNNAVAMFASLGGVPMTTKPGDCMCYADLACASAPLATLCTIGGADTPVDTSNGGMQACGETAATIDEQAKFAAAFGSR